MNTPLTPRPDGNGASAEAVAAVPSAPGAAAGYPRPATWRGAGARAAAAPGMLTGPRVAISPWFITLQRAGGNAAAVNLISGLAVAAVGAFALAGPRGFAGLRSGSALPGLWPIIAGPILTRKHAIAGSRYWSSSWAGRGADRPGRRQPGRRHPAVAGPPLTARTVRVLTGGQDPHPGPPDGHAPRDPRRRQARSSGACYEP